MNQGLRHLVIVPDGNRRWAKERGRPGYFGHREGAKTTQKIFRKALDLKIPYLTFWGSSVSNITDRTSEEVYFLFKVFEVYFKKLLNSKEVHKNKIRIRILGRWEELFPENLKKIMRETIHKTASYDGLNLTFLMAYSGFDEMTAAVQKIIDGARGAKDFEVTPQLIQQSLWSADLPSVDLVIRTGGEPHWSQGLMMWGVGESQLHFTKTLWPDFSPEEFEKVVIKFNKTERRFGK